MKIFRTFLLVILTKMNIFGFLIVAAMFFFGFDIRWGLTLPAVTWGLQVFFGALSIIAILFFMLKRKKLLLGLYGICIVIFLNLYLGAMAFYCPSLLLPKQANAPEQYVDSVENRIITLILEDKTSHRYAIVDPETNMDSYYSLDPTRIELWNDNLQYCSKVKEYDFSMLLEQLFELNKTPHTLTIQSSPENGYFVDYDHIFDRYFYDKFGGWSILRMSHPSAAGMTQISKPAYDSDTGYVLAYIGWQGDWLMGSGGFYVFKYENDNVTYLGHFETWVS